LEAAAVGSFLGLVDVGFLRSEGARALGVRGADVRPDAQAVVDWFRTLEAPGDTFVRAYWYDGAFDPAHAEYAGQRRFFDAIAFTPGIHLRLGHIAEHRSRLEKPVVNALTSTARAMGLDPEALVAEFRNHWRFLPERSQKGVDTLMALDLVRFAGRGPDLTVVVVAGDRDLAEAIRAPQDLGPRVVVATPSRGSVAREVAQLADAVIDLDVQVLRAMLPTRPPV
jgi:uncharacterized LabA/DUF88 family protein